MMKTSFVQFTGSPSKLLRRIKAINDEMTLLKSLDHKNIVKYYFIDATENYSGSVLI